MSILTLMRVTTSIRANKTRKARENAQRVFLAVVVDNHPQRAQLADLLSLWG